jgi:hypothetical protein
MQNKQKIRMVQLPLTPRLDEMVKAIKEHQGYTMHTVAIQQAIIEFYNKIIK